MGIGFNKSLNAMIKDWPKKQNFTFVVNLKV